MKRLRNLVGACLSAAVAILAGCNSGGSQLNPPSPMRQSAAIPQQNETGRKYYVDCSEHRNGKGTLRSPFNTLLSINALKLVPGDEVLFKRGSTCYGELDAAGSGKSGAPIVVDAYGVGAQPIINQQTDPSHPQAVLLNDQEYWEIRNLDIIGGFTYGILVTGSTAQRTLHHFHFINLSLHGTRNRIPSRPFYSGELFFYPQGVHEVADDVLIDGVNAYDSRGAVGIWVSVGGHSTEAQAACQHVPTPPRDLGSDVVVRNSTVHHINGTGIVVSAVRGGVMESNVVYDTGDPHGTNSGIAIWQHCAHTFRVQDNEAYEAHTSTPYDGGDYDIDLYSNDNVVQYNYGHDADGYCIASVGDPVAPDTNNIVRYNVCSNDDRNGTIAPQGEVNATGYIGITGWQIYGNTFYFNPATPSAAFIMLGDGNLNNAVIKNNIVYAVGPQMVQIRAANFTLDRNLYWTTGNSPPNWWWNGTTYTGLKAYQKGSGQETHSLNADPLLVDPTYHGTSRPKSAFTLKPGSPARGTGANVCKGVRGCSMGMRDFFGNPLPHGSGYDIGADQAP